MSPRWYARTAVESAPARSVCRSAHYSSDVKEAMLALMICVVVHACELFWCVCVCVCHSLSHLLTHQPTDPTTHRPTYPRTHAHTQPRNKHWPEAFWPVANRLYILV